MINDPDGKIIVPENVTLTSSAERSSPKRTATGAPVIIAGNVVTVPGGNFTFNAANLDIEGNVLAPGGNLSFNVYNISPVILAKADGLGNSSQSHSSRSLGEAISPWCDRFLKHDRADRR